MGDGEEALKALLAVIGQNTLNFDALVDLLIKKGVFTEQEYDEAMIDVYTVADGNPPKDPAEWASLCMTSEGYAALRGFFGSDGDD